MYLWWCLIKRGYAQRMDVGFHQGTECSEDHPVPLQARVAGKLWRHDGDSIVAATVASAGMTFVQVTLIYDFELCRLKRG